MVDRRSRPDDIDDVVALYERSAGEGDRRLATALGRLEFVRTQELVLRLLPDTPAIVADVGGGSGPYASWLAARGYMVHLIEPTSSHLEQASTRSRAGPDFQVSLGHAGALPLSEATQDAVLMLGPLYHLRDPGDRQRAWAEARRVLVEAGTVLAVAINSTQDCSTACAPSTWTLGLVRSATSTQLASWPVKLAPPGSSSRASSASRDQAASSPTLKRDGGTPRDGRRSLTLRVSSSGNRACSAQAITLWWLRSHRAVDRPIPGSSVRAGQVRLTKPVRVGEHVDGDDPAAGDGQRDDGERAAVRIPGDTSRDAVDQRSRRRLGESPERHRLRGHGLCSANDGGQLRTRLASVGADHDVRIEHRQQPLEVALARRRQERVDHRPLAVEIGVGHRRSPDPA